MKKIIIIYSTAGLGHKKAAMALLKVLQERKEETIEVKAIDLLEYASGFYRFLYTTFYIFLASHAKWFWKFMYYSSNHPFIDKLIGWMIEISDICNLKRLKRALVKESPDAIVATHFLLTGIARFLKWDKNLHSRIYAVVTDYGPHSYWLTEHADHFFVGSGSALREMVKRGVPAEKMTATGIPTTRDFCESLDTGRLKKEYGLDEKRKTIFVLSGGFGVGPMEKILLSLTSCQADIQVIAVCGHNKAMFEDIRVLQDRLDYPVKLFGYTDKVAELMAISDLMITKAGGISVTEALNMRLPMILFDSIPGQETWNEKFLLEYGAAEKAEHIKEIPDLVNKMLLSDDAYDAVKAGIDKIRRPNAAEDIVDVVLKDMRDV